MGKYSIVHIKYFQNQRLIGIRMYIKWKYQTPPQLIIVFPEETQTKAATQKYKDQSTTSSKRQILKTTNN